MDPAHPKTRPTRKVLDGSENIRIIFRVLFLSSGRRRVIYILVWTRFFFWVEKTLLQQRSLSISLYSPPPSVTSQVSISQNITANSLSFYLRNCSNKVCFLFQFFWVLGFVLVSGFLFFLTDSGLGGLWFVCVNFCSHCSVFSWFLGFWVCFG